MREILFRGERLDNGECVEGFYIVKEDPILSGVSYSFIVRQEGENPFVSWYKVDPSTVGQYTGLEDKNGKRIFDGDVIRFGGHILYVYWNDEVYGWQAKRNVEYPYRRFPNKKWDYVDLGWIAAEIPCTGHISVEVIGNIHDNPELLKGGEG